MLQMSRNKSCTTGAGKTKKKTDAKKTANK